jgi:hypothetical protein
VDINPSQLGTLELDGIWVPLIDMVDDGFVHRRVTVGPDEYGFESSMIVRGHGAVLPGRIRSLRDEGKKSLIVERGDRYYIYVSPPPAA